MHDCSIIPLAWFQTLLEFAVTQFTYLWLAVCLSLSGCRAIQPDYSLFKTEHERSIDELWREGYGKDNPNIDRIRDRELPLNFDGTPNTFESTAEQVGERALGNALAFALFEGIPAMFRGLFEKIHRR